MGIQQDTGLKAGANARPPERRTPLRGLGMRGPEWSTQPVCHAGQMPGLSQPTYAFSWLFPCIIVAHALWCFGFIARTSFVVEGQRFFCLFDDAMISMRYARNLASGFGLVWNPEGERVEGFTNPLWVGWMTLMHLFPVRAATTSLLIQLTSWIALIADLFVIRAIACRLFGTRSLAVPATVFAVAAFYPLNFWALEGTEVGLLALAISLAILWTIDTVQSGRSLTRVYLLLAVATWVRLDAAIPFVAILLFLTAGSFRCRTGSHLTGVLVLVVSLGVQTAVRLWYYGDPLPNTYYLKLTGVSLADRVARGAFVAGQQFMRMNPVLVALPLLSLWPRRDPRCMLLLTLFLAQLAYSVWVGGDAWEFHGSTNRFLTTAMPAYLVLFVWVGRRLWMLLLSRRGGAHRRERHPMLAGSYVVAFFAACLAFNAPAHEGMLGEMLLIDPPMHTEDNRLRIAMAVDLKRRTLPSARVAVVCAGVLPYFLDRTCIDLLGRCDRHVAAVPPYVPPGAPIWERYYPGHDKWDLAYSIGQLKPDVIAERWPPERNTAPVLWMNNYTAMSYVPARCCGLPILVRNGSSQFSWTP